MEVARKTGFAVFAEFQAAVVALPLAFDGKVLSSGDLGGDQLTLHAARTAVPQVNGRTLDLASPKVFDSPFIQSKYDSGVVEIHKGGRSLVLDFND